MRRRSELPNRSMPLPPVAPARYEFASLRDVYAEKCTVSAVDGPAAPVCNADMGGRARKALARRLRVLRSMRGWTQEDLAEACGLHRTYVSLVECGQCNVGLDNLERLAEAFGMDLTELFSVGEPAVTSRRRRRSA